MKRLISCRAKSKAAVSYVGTFHFLKTNSNLRDKVSFSLFCANLDGVLYYLYYCVYYMIIIRFFSLLDVNSLTAGCISSCPSLQSQRAAFIHSKFLEYPLCVKHLSRDCRCRNEQEGHGPCPHGGNILGKK